MPLLALAPQLNSTCNLKSWNFCSLMISGPCPGLISVPSATFQVTEFASLIFHPVRSFPLNREIGFPHLGLPFRWRSGALTADHVHRAPLGPVSVPERAFPSGFPTKIRSVDEPSSSLGETKVISRSETSTLGIGRAFPHPPTLLPPGYPFSYS